MAIIEIELGGLDVGLVELHSALVLLDDEGLVLGLLVGDRILGQQFLVADEIRLRLLEKRLIVFELGLGLVERRLVRARIDQEAVGHPS